HDGPGEGRGIGYCVLLRKVYEPRHYRARETSLSSFRFELAMFLWGFSFIKNNALHATVALAHPQSFGSRRTICLFNIASGGRIIGFVHFKLYGRNRSVV